MDDRDIISASLTRPLQPGGKYNRLISGTNCTISPLKSGDTFTTVSHMKLWVQKHLDHTARLAPVLKGESLRKTANNIYRFLYDHIQYRADGAMQTLKSPGCTWTTRKEGADCKTFSIFASSILTNLGIQHAIRQVKQPGYYPDQFTHVYVVIPINQKIKKLNNAEVIVIDATRHENTEVIYLEKNDTLMLQHQGLSAPGIIGEKNPSIQGDNTQKAQLLVKLYYFATLLAKAGVPVATSEAIQQRVYNYWLNGIDPKMSISSTEVTVQGQRYIFKKGLNGTQGLGFDVSGLISQNGAIEGTASTALNTVVPGAGFAIGPILAELNLSENFKLVSQYGLSSWGASGSPEKAKTDWQNVTLPALQKLINKLESYKNIGETLSEIQVFIDNYAAFAQGLRDYHSKAKSTRLGNEWKLKNIKEIEAEIITKTISQLRAAGVIVNTYIAGKSEVKPWNVPFDERTLTPTKDTAYTPNQYTQYEVIVPQSLMNSQTGINKNLPQTSVPNQTMYPTPTTTATGDYQNSYDQVQQTSSGTVQSAGFPWVPAIALLGAGVSFYMYQQKTAKNGK